MDLFLIVGIDQDFMYNFMTLMIFIKIKLLIEKYK